MTAPDPAAAGSAGAIGAAGHALSVRLIGPGRAGSAMVLALGRAGWHVHEPRGRGDAVADAAAGTDLVLIAVPDASIASVAASVEPVPNTVVAHLAGSLGLDALEPHHRRAAIHPLVALPTAETGAARLVDDAWFAIAGDPMAARVVADLGGRSFTVADENRAAYHAAACIASNHLVALLGQAGRVAASAGVPLEAYLQLVRATVSNVAELGPAAALTGPAARGDWPTIERHRRALHALDDAIEPIEPIDPVFRSELETYDAMVRAARRLVGGDP